MRKRQAVVAAVRMLGPRRADEGHSRPSKRKGHVLRRGDDLRPLLFRRVDHLRVGLSLRLRRRHKEIIRFASCPSASFIAPSCSSSEPIATAALRWFTPQSSSWPQSAAPVPLPAPTQHGVAVRADENRLAVARAQRLDRQPVRIHAVCPLRQLLRHASETIRQLDSDSGRKSPSLISGRLSKRERRRARLRIALPQSPAHARRQTAAPPRRARSSRFVRQPTRQPFFRLRT